MAAGRPTNDCYVYAHIREDINKPFYIGIGKTSNYKRAFDIKKRNNIWKKVFNKTKSKANIIYTNLTWAEACEIEINLINYLGRIDKGTGVLTNLTDGGEGAYGVIFTKERCDKISKALTGVKLSPERVEKCKQRRHTEYSKNKIRIEKTGLKASESTKAKMRISNLKGIKASAEKISKPLIDYNTGVFYNSVRDASKVLGISHGYLSGMLLGRYSNKTNLSYA